MTSHFPSKKQFFTDIERLDDVEDSQNEDNHLEQLIIGSRSQRNPVVVASPVSNSGPVALPRANPDPQPSSDTSGVPREVHGRRSTGLTDPKMTVKRSQTTGGMAGTKNGGPAPKKRRTNNIQTIPEDQKIFRDLVFFFFPSNVISPLRRLRIQRAQEYGARCSREWDDNITHVIVDNGLIFQDLLTHLRIESWPKTNIALVNESYPSDCIRFRSVLSPSQARFRVDGTTGVSEIEQPPIVEPSSPGSLPLKSPGKDQRQSPEPSQSYNGEEAPARPSIPVASEQMQEVENGSDAPGHERDTLDEIIDEAKAARHLPLDPLDSLEDQTTAEASDEDCSGSEPETGGKVRMASSKEVKAADAWMQNFVCMQKFEPSTNKNPNGRTIEVLQQMLDYYTRTADQWRVLAYRKAINALRRQPQRVVTRSQALSIPGIGTRLADKIEEIVLTNHLRRLDNASGTPEDLIIQEFLGVYGAGLAQASQWVAQGYRSLEDLREKAPLTKNQRIGVDHYHDFAQRIPRKEVEAHGDIVRKAVQQVDSEMQVIIGGSYRRGALDSGDIDVLITKPGASLEQIRSMMMDVAIPQLFSDSFLQVSLAISRQEGSKWHGASALPGSRVWRRIDLLFVPGAEIGAALIYFTGNDIFNRSMRLLASKKHMCLNQKGLYADVLRTTQRIKLNPGRLLEGRDERRIFTLLGVPWRPPEQRIC
ncbi:hypothetical protein NUU61_006724 [Penicillium alfredii]|uniref:DNA polymerase lambda n=1 Tax=Penicillium alfredii TaxID=1506179 RepID=A0A9W9F1J3_9EURO|nr:uncharacterized protein NUU61_006724 [Penicillium alfredii]KAJ5091854.1 hypothetical protein NUU61_006724 [Penicillium alfredii]